MQAVAQSFGFEIGRKLWTGTEPATPANPRSHGPEDNRGPRNLGMLEFPQGDMVMTGRPFGGLEDKGFANAVDRYIPGKRPAPSASHGHG